MRVSLVCLLLCCVLMPVFGRPSGSTVTVQRLPTGVEKEVLDELNLARTQPQQYVARLKELRGRMQGDFIILPGGVRMTTQEGTRAVDEAIAFLGAQRPIGALTPVAGLSQAAADQVRDQGPKGSVGHEGSDGSDPSSRIERYGRWLGSMGECIAYGQQSGRDIVVSLIVDDGVPNRGHRKNIFNPAFRAVGIAAGPHAEYRTMSVIDFAGGFQPK